MVRGEGEWRNMQEVIRKTFKITFLQLERQQEQIEKLMGVTSTLREALSTKMTEKEVELLLATRLRDTKKGPKEDMAIMMHQLSEIKAEVERKASLRYVDDSLRRKVDKSDVLVRTSQSIQTSQAASNAFAGFNAEVTKLSGEVGSLRGKFDGMEKLLADQNDRIRSSATTGDMLGVQNQLNQLYKAVQECPRKEEIVRIYDKKVDRREFEKALLDKADKSSVTSSFARIEDVLGEQERTLTATRLKVNDLLISKSTKEPSAVGFTEQILSPIKPIHKSQQYQNKSAPLDENFSESRMQDGRTDALLNGMWQKVVQMQRDLERAQFDYRDTDGKITALQETLKSVITVEERDVILSSIKEVARRLDSILNGVLPIKPIESMLTDLSEKIQDIQGFLHLPQAKPLRSQFGELKNMLDQIEHRVTEISQYPISRIQDRLDKVEDAQVSLESHMRQVESASKVGESLISLLCYKFSFEIHMEYFSTLYIKGMETRFDEKLTSNIHLIKNKLRETVSPSKRNLVDDMQDDVREMKSALARIEQDRRGRWSAQRASEVMTEVIARQTNLEEK